MRGFQASGFFALRTPLLPFDDIERWSEGVALEDDPATVRARLRELLERPGMSEAVYLASPTLYDGYRAWRDDPGSERGRAAEHGLVAYFVRAASRPTPFGLFAGCSIGSVAAQTQLELQAGDRYARHSRLDNDLLWSVADAVARDPTLRAGIELRPSSSLYRAGGHLRYVASRDDPRGGRSYSLVGANETGPLLDTVERARRGATAHELADALTSDSVTGEQAAAFVRRLVDAQVLVPDVYPRVTGPAPAAHLAATLAGRTETAPVAAALAKAADLLAAIDECSIGVTPERYTELARALEELPVPVDPARLVQVDMTKPVRHATIARGVVDDLAQAVDVLRRLAPRPRDDLPRFRERFAERFQTREVPLMEALDAELGIGFEATDAPGTEASPLLHGLSFAVKTERRQPWGAREVLLLRKLLEAAATRSHEVVLTRSELEGLEPAALPDAFAVQASVALDGTVVVEGAAGPSGVRLLGRFCHADPETADAVAAHVRAEEALDPGRVYAEVVHLPAGRVGNVLSRPVLREWEIAYLGESGAPGDRRLPVTDLMLSVRDDRLVLRSATLDREVVPRMTTAHVFEHGLGVYRFLGALQEQDVAGSVSFDWTPFDDVAFLPRVVHGRAVLAKARWNVFASELKPLAGAGGHVAAGTVRAWLERRRIPRHAALASGDNQLLVDFENPLSVETFLRLAKRQDACALVEVLPAPDQLAVTGPEGRFVHELVVPFVSSAPRAATASETRVPAVARGFRRSFPPGSEWLYLKIYSGPATADRTLAALARRLHRLAPEGWFFLRYADPDWHLRVRVHGEPERLRDDVLPALQDTVAPLVDAGLVHRVQIDTYEREVERYGGPDAILVAERIFRADSECVAGLLELRELAGDSGADARWRLALTGIDSLLSDLGLTLEDKERWARKARDDMAEEHHADALLKRQLGERYRAERAAIEASLEAPGNELTARRSRAVQAGAAELRALEASGRLSVPVHDLAWSYAHMFVNRLLRASHRAQELVLYDFLARAYRTMIARR